MNAVPPPPDAEKPLEFRHFTVDLPQPVSLFHSSPDSAAAVLQMRNAILEFIGKSPEPAPDPTKPYGHVVRCKVRRYEKNVGITLVVQPTNGGNEYERELYSLDFEKNTLSPRFQTRSPDFKYADRDPTLLNILPTLVADPRWDSILPEKYPLRRPPVEKVSRIIKRDFKLPRFISVSLLDNHPAVQHIREHYAFEAEKRFIHITGFQASRTESCIGISLRLNFGGGSDVLTDEVYFLDIVDQRISPRIQGTSSFADPSKDPILRALLDHLTSGPGWAELNPEGFSIREPRAS